MKTPCVSPNFLQRFSKQIKHYRLYFLCLYSCPPKKAEKKFRIVTSLKNDIRRQGVCSCFRDYLHSGPRDGPSPQCQGPPRLSYVTVPGTHLSGCAAPRRACSRPRPRWSHLRNEASG